MNCYSFLIEHNGEQVLISDIYHDTADLAFNALQQTLAGAVLLETFES